MVKIARRNVLAQIEVHAMLPPESVFVTVGTLGMDVNKVRQTYFVYIANG